MANGKLILSCIGVLLLSSAFAACGGEGGAIDLGGAAGETGSGGQASGGQTSGGQASGGEASGGRASGGEASGGRGSGGNGAWGGLGGTGSENEAPVADPGAAIDASMSTNVTLDGSGSMDPEGEPIDCVWTQVLGPDVTAGAGFLTGRKPSFVAPAAVGTLAFELVVDDGEKRSAPAIALVNVFEDVNAMYFVDGDAGDDETGTGSRENPFATVGHALRELKTSLSDLLGDIYVKTRADGESYDETAEPLDIPAGTSLYGGYDDDWHRDAEGNKTALLTDHLGVQFVDVSFDAWFSGFDLTTGDSPSAGEDVFGLFAEGDGEHAITVEDNVIRTGDVSNGRDANPGSNYGLALLRLSEATVARNEITVGDGGDGEGGAEGDVGAPGDDGSPGSQATGGGGGATTNHPGGNGGRGGDAGTGADESGDSGGQGGPGTDPVGGTTPAGGTSGQVGNPGGRGLPGTSPQGAGTVEAELLLFEPPRGSVGDRGGHGSGGGGGRGGDASLLGVNGGGGGGGGEGGQGGAGGSGGSGGGASIGVWLAGVGVSSLQDNRISCGEGGGGAAGGLGGDGALGGDGGTGADGNQGVGEGGKGGNGRQGGQGGRGGTGSAGAGGPSYGVAFASGVGPTLSGNAISSGDGGVGGNGAARGSSGGGGYSFAVYDFDLSDNVFATLSQNDLDAGTPGAAGVSEGADGAETGDPGQSGSKNWQ